MISVGGVSIVFLGETSVMMMFNLLGLVTLGWLLLLAT